MIRGPSTQPPEVLKIRGHELILPLNVWHSPNNNGFVYFHKIQTPYIQSYQKNYKPKWCEYDETVYIENF